MYIAGILITSFALPSTIGAFCIFDMVIRDPYALRSAYGFTREKFIAFCLLLSLLTITGIVLIILGLIKKKNKAVLDSITNLEKQKFCTSCNINVAEQCTSCPNCGKSLEK